MKYFIVTRSSGEYSDYSTENLFITSDGTVAASKVEELTKDNEKAKSLEDDVQLIVDQWLEKNPRPECTFRPSNSEFSIFKEESKIHNEKFKDFMDDRKLELAVLYGINNVDLISNYCIDYSFDFEEVEFIK